MISKHMLETVSPLYHKLTTYPTNIQTNYSLINISELLNDSSFFFLLQLRPGVMANQMQP